MKLLLRSRHSARKAQDDAHLPKAAGAATASTERRTELGAFASAKTSKESERDAARAAANIESTHI